MYSFFANNGFSAAEAAQISEIISIVIIVVLALVLVCVIANYVIRAMSLYRISRRRGIGGSGMAWVPIFCVWTLGAIADEYDGRLGVPRKWRFVMLILALISTAGIIAVSVAAAQGSIGTYTQGTATNTAGNYSNYFTYMLPWYACIPGILLGGLSVCAFVCTYKVYESCKPKSSVLLLLLATMVPFAAPFCLLSCRNWDNGVKAEKSTQPEISALPEIPQMEHPEQFGSEQ